MARDYDPYSDYAESPAQSHRRSRRYRRADELDEPEVEDLRRAREDYYSIPSEERRRREPKSRMAQDEAGRPVTGTRTRNKASSGREHRRRRPEAEGTRQRSKDREVDEVVYVYNNADHEVEELPPVIIQRPTRSRTTPKSSRRVRAVEIRPSRSTRDVRREVGDSSDSRRKSRRDVTTIYVESPPEAVDLPKLSRSRSTYDARRSVRPGLRRATTVSRPRAPSIPDSERRVTRAASVSGRTHVSTSPNKTRRASAGFLNTFFGPPPPRAPQKRVDCVICMADDIPISRTAKLECGHRQCHSCLKRNFELSVTDPSRMPPTCCTAEHVPLKHVERLFSDKFKILWNKKYQEYTTKNRIYCPVRGCGEWIKPSNIKMDTSVGRKYGKCNRCKTKICILCNGKWHMRKDCPKDEETKQFLATAKEEGWQRCHNCKHMVQLKEGCNHMTCRCGAQFCMRCGKRWKTCECPWFNYPPDTSDQLNYMQIPQVIQVPDGPPPMPPPLPTATFLPHIPPPPLMTSSPSRPPPLLHSHSPMLPPPVPSPGAYHAELAARRAQERADEALARRFANVSLSSVPRTYTLTRTRTTRDSSPMQSAAGMEIEVYGTGNAAADFVNESYALRPSSTPTRPHRHQQQQTRSHTPSRNTSNPSPRGSGWNLWGSRQSSLRRRGRGGEEGGTPSSSTMAGLSRDGSRTGAARVGLWARHVLDDPAEVEGRNGMLGRGMEGEGEWGDSDSDWVDDRNF